MATSPSKSSTTATGIVVATGLKAGPTPKSKRVGVLQN